MEIDHEVLCPGEDTSGLYLKHNKDIECACHADPHVLKVSKVCFSKEATFWFPVTLLA